MRRRFSSSIGGTIPAGEGIERGYSAADVVRLRGSVRHRVHLGAPRCGTSVEGAGNRTLRARPWGSHRKPGGTDGQGGAAVHLSLRVAGGGGRQQRGPDVPGPEPVPGRQRPRPHPQYQRRPGTGRSDPPCRGRRLDRLVPSHRGRRGGRVRRRAECLRADEGHDRCGGGGLCTSRTSSRRRRSAATWAARCCFRPGSRSRS